MTINTFTFYFLSELKIKKRPENCDVTSAGPGSTLSIGSSCRLAVTILRLIGGDGADWRCSSQWQLLVFPYCLQEEVVEIVSNRCLLVAPRQTVVVVVHE